MTDLINSLEALAGKVTPGEWSHVRNPENTRWIIDSKPAHAIACTAGFEPDNEANAAAICLLHNNLPAIIAALKVAELVRDEDWLAERIDQSLDVDWTPRDGARINHRGAGGGRVMDVHRKIANIDKRIVELLRKRDDALRDHSEQLGFKPCNDCVNGFCTMNCSNAPTIIKAFFP